MGTALVSGAFPVGRPLMPDGRIEDLVYSLRSSAPNLCAAAYFVPAYSGRVMPCADALWCAQQVASGRNRSEEVGRAIAWYARKFSQESYMNRDSLTSLTAITTLGSSAVRRVVLDNDMGNEVAQCLRVAASLGRIAQRHAAAEVMTRYAIDAAEDYCDGGLLLGAVSALTDVISALREYRSRLGRNYNTLMIGSLRSLENVGRYVGKNAVSAEATDLLRTMIRMDEVGMIRTGAMQVATAICAKPKVLPCAPAKPVSVH